MKIDIEIWEEVKDGFTLPPLSNNWCGLHISDDGKYVIYTRGASDGNL
jgi:hypothetical protein